ISVTPISFFHITLQHPPRPTLFPYTTLFRSQERLPRLPNHHAQASRDFSGGCCPPCREGISSSDRSRVRSSRVFQGGEGSWRSRSEEHTSELQSLAYLVCRLLLEKKKQQQR